MSSTDVGPDTLGLVAAMVAADGPLTSSASTEPAATSGTAEHRTALKVLDLCCGCGVQSLSVAMCREVRGVGKTSLTMIDRSSRAVRFARFNTLLNTEATTTHVEVHCGDACDVASLLPHRSQPYSFDALLINPPYIPNPEKAAGLETFGDGGWSGEELTAAAVSQSVSLLRPHDGILAVVANLPNADAYNEKLQRWWDVGIALERASDDAARSSDTRGLDATVLCGCKWSPQRYAELIHMYDSSSTTSTTADNYARALERSGVKDVCNGFVFARTGQAPADAQVSTVACVVSASHEQVWQAVAGACGHNAAQQAQAAASKACGAS